MKVTFNIWERQQLNQLLENVQIAGGIKLGQIDMALSLKSKIQYSGKKKDDPDLDTELTLEEKEVSFLKQKAFATQGWPVNERAKQLKDRLEKYAA